MPVIEGAVGAPLQSAGAPGAGTDAVQTLTIGGTPTGGSFRLRFGGFVTAAITWTAVDATLVSAIDAALEALPNIGAGGIVTADVTLTSGIGDGSITFSGSAMAKRVQPLITVEANDLTGTAPTVSVAETTPGVNAFGRGAPKGSLATDTTNGILYINTGTALAPTWTKVGTQT